MKKRLLLNLAALLVIGAGAQQLHATTLRILLPEATPYSFFRKYLRPAPRAPLADIGLAERVRRTALEIARTFEVDWAARVDLIHEMESDRLRFLECDVAPLVGANSAFAASLEAAGIARTEQLQMLMSRRCGSR